MIFTIFLFLLIIFTVTLIFNRHPKKMILFVIAFSPVINLFWFVRIFGFSLIDATIGVLPIIVILPFLQKIKFRRWINGRFFSGYLVLFSAMIVPTIFLISNGQVISAVQLIFKLSLGFISYQIFLNFFQYEERWKLIKAIYLAIVITIIVVIFQLLTGYGTQSLEEHSSYLTGFYADEGNLTRMALFGIIITLSFRGNILERKNKLLFRFVFFMSLSMFALALSRNTVLAAVAIIFIYSILQRKIFFIFFVFFIGALIFSSSEIARLSYQKKLDKEIRYLRGEKVTFETLGSGRIGRWKKVIEDFKRADIIQSIFGTGRGIGPHGQFFDLLRRTGIYGVVVIILFYLKLTFYSIEHLRRSRGDPFPLFCFLLLIAFWVLFIGATPLYSFYLQILIFGFFAFLEKGVAFKKSQIELINNNQSTWPNQK